MPLTTWTLLRDQAPEAAHRLLLGSVGQSQHTATAESILAKADPGAHGARLPALGRDMLQAAWEEDSLNGVTARRLAAMERQSPGLDPAVARAVNAVAELWNPPDDLRYFQRIAMRREFAKVAAFIDARLAEDPGNLFWVQRALIHGAVAEDLEYALDRLRGLPDALAFVPHTVHASFAMRSGNHAEAAEAFGRALTPRPGDTLPLPGLAERLAHCMLLAGEADAARSVWADLVRLRPWHVNLVLRLHDALTGRAGAVTPLPGPVAVCLYSFNKADLLDATLDSLMASDLDGAAGGVTVAALDNGSPDATSEVLAAWTERAGERLKVISLPVNVGAAAARNWLMQAPETAGAEFLAYLDDDTELPPDWLGRLGAAVDAYPDAGVWGCKVVDHHAPLTVQHADMHLLPGQGDEPPDPGQTLGRRFTLSNAHAEVLDFGHFDYLRPCTSVTGCCHLFRAHDLRRAGGFSIHLSPSQYDDLEHDLRLADAGGQAVYQGHLRVRHKKVAGRHGRRDTAQHGNAVGNMYKLQAMFENSRLTAVMERQRLALESDYLAKAALVAEALGTTDEAAP